MKPCQLVYSCKILTNIKVATLRTWSPPQSAPQILQDTSTLLAYIFGMCPIRMSVFTLTMERNPSWEANRSSNAVKIPHVLWNFKFNYRAHKTHNPSLSTSRSIQSRPLHLVSWGSILILSSHLPLGFLTDILMVTHQNSACNSPLCHTHKMPRSCVISPPE